MTDVERLLSEFIDAWNSGGRPDVDEYLERADEDRRDELADQIVTFLAVAPEPAYGEQALAALAADPLVQRLAAWPPGPAEPWPRLLPRLREKAGLSLGEVARGVSQRLGLSGREAKVERWLDTMESGAIARPEKVSERLLGALGQVLGIPWTALDWRGFAPPPAAAPAMRSAATARAEKSLDVLADLILTEPDEDWDEVDDLFTAGRQAH